MERGKAEWWQCGRDEYDADPALRSSALKDYRRSPKIYQWRYVTGQMKPPEQTKEMLLGTMFHSLVLENRIDWEIAKQCENTYATGKRKGQQCWNPGIGKDEMGRWLCGQHSKGIDLLVPDSFITEKEEADLLALAAELKKSDAARWLENHYAESAIKWCDMETEIVCKGLPDIVTYDGTIVDIKTTAEFNAESIWRKIERLGWGFSMAFYERGLQHLFENFQMKMQWVLIVCEMAPPYRCQEFPLDPAYQDVCRREVGEEMVKLKNSLDTGVFRDKPLETGVPQWVFFARENKGTPY